MGNVCKSTNPLKFIFINFSSHYIFLIYKLLQITFLIISFKIFLYFPIKFRNIFSILFNSKYFIFLLSFLHSNIMRNFPFSIQYLSPIIQ